MPSLGIILASVRPGRVGLPVAHWFTAQAEEHGAFDVELIDLAEVDLPLLDESKHPRFGEYEKDHTREWSDRIAPKDAFVFVTSEYNYGYPPSLKNAIDYLHKEWRHKPLGFVSYGGVAAGTRAVQQLRQVVGSLNMFDVTPAVNIPFVKTLMDDDGNLTPNDSMPRAATAMLDELATVEPAMRSLRT